MAYFLICSKCIHWWLFEINALYFWTLLDYSENEWTIWNSYISPASLSPTPPWSQFSLLLISCFSIICILQLMSQCFSIIYILQLMSQYRYIIINPNVTLGLLCVVHSMSFEKCMMPHISHFIITRIDFLSFYLCFYCGKSSSCEIYPLSRFLSVQCGTVNYRYNVL